MYQEKEDILMEMEKRGTLAAEIIREEREKSDVERLKLKEVREGLCRKRTELVQQEEELATDSQQQTDILKLQKEQQELTHRTGEERLRLKEEQLLQQFEEEMIKLQLREQQLKDQVGQREKQLQEQRAQKEAELKEREARLEKHEIESQEGRRVQLREERARRMEILRAQTQRDQSLLAELEAQERSKLPESKRPPQSSLMQDSYLSGLVSTLDRLAPKAQYAPGKGEEGVAKPQPPLPARTPARVPHPRESTPWPGQEGDAGPGVTWQDPPSIRRTLYPGYDQSYEQSSIHYQKRDTSAEYLPPNLRPPR